MLVVFALAAIATFVIAFWTQKIVTSYFLHNYLYGKSKFKGQLSVYRFAIVYGKAVAATFGLLGVLGLLIFFLGKGGGDGIFGILFGWFFEIVGGSVSPLVGGTLKYILVIIVGIVFYTGMLAFNFYVVAIVRAGIREHVYANATVDNRVSFESTVTAFGLFKISFINFLINIVTCGFGTPFTKVRMAKFLAAHTFVHSVGELDAFVGEKREEVGAFGDELGDAFDMDMDIGF